MRTDAGPTGEKVVSRHPGDRGGLNAALTIKKAIDGSPLIHVDFNTSITFIAMRPSETIIFAEALLKAAKAAT